MRGLGVLELDGSPYVASLELGDLGAVFARHDEELGEPFFGVGIHIQQVLVLGEYARGYLEVVDFTDVGLYGGFEYEERGGGFGIAGD